ncbi:efflux RND transporter permease subunit [Biformimicrobium ophioploci]|uniref:Efflux RND transporter permease subunit n=1 Tax=Biformimicrobium ophioploci TaxID=3036711 RepID=A0ABQ6LUK8_9GAMM|nr:efflux RND transporter permease subunit [Microbulbifer sp. NKW57]GMG85764.1 efflux RND transporter permease subunit [Microbulbifer sp. NKW57]
MALTAAALKNPAATAVGVVMTIVLGIFLASQLPIQLLPSIEKPRIFISAGWRAASPQEMESEIAQPIESVLKGLTGMETMEVSINPGRTSVELEFGLGTDMNKTLINVISRLNRLPPLPRDATPPQVNLGGRGGDAEALTYYFLQVLEGNDTPVSEYVQFLEDVVKPQIESIDGVAAVQVRSRSSNQDELQILFDPWKAAEQGIQIPQVAQRLASSRNISGGTVDVGRRQYSLRFEGEYDPEKLGDLILEWRGGQPVHLRDIAEVKVGPGQDFGMSIQNGNPAVSMRIDKESGANLLATLAEVKDKVAEINEDLLADKQLAMVQSFDSSVFIYRALNLLGGNLLLGILFAVGVLWWFLRRRRATLIVAAAIPISLLATFIILSAAGRTVNVISLAGLAFASGMVLDAAIVVLENIVRLREKGEPAFRASLEGATQVWGALLASTATTIAIFLPVFFLESVEGQIFGDLALTISVAVVFSLLVAVLVVPVAAKLWLPAGALEDRLADRWKKWAGKIMAFTGKPSRRPLIIVTMLALPLLVTLPLLPTLDYLPPVKNDQVNVRLSYPNATNMTVIREEIVAELSRRMAPYMKGEKEPALKNYFIITWSAGGLMGARVQDISRIGEIEHLLRTEITKDIPDFRGFVSRGSLFGGFGGGRGLDLHIQSPDEDAMIGAAQKAIDLLAEALPGVPVRPQPNLERNSPEYTVRPDDHALYEQGWSRQALGSVVRALGNGLYVGEYFNGENRLDIILRAKEWRTQDDMARTPLAMPNGAVLPLSSIASVERTTGAGQIRRLDGRRTITLSVLPPDDKSLEELVAIIEAQVLPGVKAELSDGNVLLGGNASDLQNALKSLSQNFVLALIILFLLMSALFRSVKDAGLVLLTLPLATVGGALALRALNLVTFQPLDLLTMMGFVILLGLVVNNAILLVHQTRAAERNGATRLAAVEQALTLRMRPIFMSTLTSIFGMLPLLIAPGEGAAIYRGLAAVIVGGMAVSTLFTLILLPTLLQLGKAPAPVQADDAALAAER